MSAGSQGTIAQAKEDIFNDFRTIEKVVAKAGTCNLYVVGSGLQKALNFLQKSKQAVNVKRVVFIHPTQLSLVAEEKFREDFVETYAKRNGHILKDFSIKTFKQLMAELAIKENAVAQEVVENSLTIFT